MAPSPGAFRKAGVEGAVRGEHLGGSEDQAAYFKALNRAKAQISLNLRLERLERSGNKIRAVFFDDYTKDHVDQVVVEHGTLPADDLHFALRPHSRNDGEVDQSAFIAGEPQRIVRNADACFSLFRIGDAVASRNIHAAIYDAHRLMATF